MVVFLLSGIILNMDLENTNSNEKLPGEADSKITEVDKVLKLGMTLKGMLQNAESAGNSQKIAEIREMISENQKAIEALDNKYRTEVQPSKDEEKDDVWGGGYAGGNTKKDFGQNNQYGSSIRGR